MTKGEWCQVGDREHPFRVAAGDPHEIGQGPAARGGVEDEVDRSIADGPDPFNHAGPVGRDRSPEISQSLGVRLARGGDHSQAPQQRDQSAGASPQAWTTIRIRFGPGAGTGTVSSRRTSSGSPYS